MITNTFKKRFLVNKDLPKEKKLAIRQIGDELGNIRRHTGRSYVADKWKDYNRYQYLTMKRNIINSEHSEEERSEGCDLQWQLEQK